MNYIATPSGIKRETWFPLEFIALLFLSLKKVKVTPKGSDLSIYIYKQPALGNQFSLTLCCFEGSVVGRVQKLCVGGFCCLYFWEYIQNSHFSVVRWDVRASDCRFAWFLVSSTQSGFVLHTDYSQSTSRCKGIGNNGFWLHVSWASSLKSVPFTSY